MKKTADVAPDSAEIIETRSPGCSPLRPCRQGRSNTDDFGRYVLRPIRDAVFFKAEESGTANMHNNLLESGIRGFFDSLRTSPWRPTHTDPFPHEQRAPCHVPMQDGDPPQKSDGATGEPSRNGNRRLPDERHCGGVRCPPRCASERRKAVAQSASSVHDSNHRRIVRSPPFRGSKRSALDYTILTIDPKSPNSGGQAPF